MKRRRLTPVLLDNSLNWAHDQALDGVPPFLVSAEDVADDYLGVPALPATGGQPPSDGGTHGGMGRRLPFDRSDRGSLEEQVDSLTRIQVANAHRRQDRQAVLRREGGVTRLRAVKRRKGRPAA